MRLKLTMILRIFSFNVVGARETLVESPGPSSRNKHANRDRASSSRVVCVCVTLWPAKKRASRVRDWRTLERACARARARYEIRTGGQDDGRQEAPGNREWWLARHKLTLAHAFSGSILSHRSGFPPLALPPPSPTSFFFFFLPSPIQQASYLGRTRMPGWRRNAFLPTYQSSKRLILLCVYIYTFGRLGQRMFRKYHALSVTSNNRGEEERAKLC